MSVQINAVATAVPEFTRKTAEIIPFLEQWLHGQDERFVRKVVKIFESALVDQRYAIMDPVSVFTADTFAQKNRIYKDAAVRLGTQVLEKALQNAAWNPDELDYIITVSCTGIMIPSLDAYLINNLKLKQDIVRLPVTEMGCVAGVSALIYATHFLKANPGKKAAIVAFESPSATFQLDDFSMANMVSAAIFGDGAACVLLSESEEVRHPQILSHEMYHFFDKEHMMGFDLVEGGLKMVLDVEVPDTIAEHFPNIIHPFLEKNNLTIDGIDHLIFHPGGKKIIQTVETLFGDLGKNLNATKSVLSRFGNMSSATVLFVLEEVLKSKPKSGEHGLMLSFGPGFTAQRLLIEF